MSDRSDYSSPPGGAPPSQTFETSDTDSENFGTGQVGQVVEGCNKNDAVVDSTPKASLIRVVGRDTVCPLLPQWTDFWTQTLKLTFLESNLAAHGQFKEVLNKLGTMTGNEQVKAEWSKKFIEDFKIQTRVLKACPEKDIPEEKILSPKDVTDLIFENIKMFTQISRYCEQSQGPELVGLVDERGVLQSAASYKIVYNDFLKVEQLATAPWNLLLRDDKMAVKGAGAALIGEFIKVRGELVKDKLLTLVLNETDYSRDFYKRLDFIKKSNPSGCGMVYTPRD